MTEDKRIFKDRYVEISTNDDKTYYLNPIDGWTCIIKSIYKPYI